MGREVCKNCKRPQKVCFCHLLKKIDNLWPVHIIQHAEEVSHSIGTAKIAQLSLNKCHTQVLNDSEIVTSLDKTLEHGILVYPGGDQPALSLADLQHETPKPLILIDASWRKSRKILFESAFLQTLPRVSFEFPGASRYRIRKEPKPGYCSTLEAIVTLLSTLEGASEKYASLLDAMDWMIDQQIKSMGQEVFLKNY